MEDREAVGGIGDPLRFVGEVYVSAGCGLASNEAVEIVVCICRRKDVDDVVEDGNHFTHLRWPPNF